MHMVLSGHLDGLLSLAYSFSLSIWKTFHEKVHHSDFICIRNGHWKKIRNYDELAKQAPTRTLSDCTNSANFFLKRYLKQYKTSVVYTVANIELKLVVLNQPFEKKGSSC